MRAVHRLLHVASMACCKGSFRGGLQAVPTPLSREPVPHLPLRYNTSMCVKGLAAVQPRQTSLKEKTSMRRGFELVPHLPLRYGRPKVSIFSRTPMKSLQITSRSSSELCTKKDLRTSDTDIKTNLDWNNLSYQGFLDALQALKADCPEFEPAMLCKEERLPFLKRRGEVAWQMAGDISDFIQEKFGDVNLVAALDEIRGRNEEGFTNGEEKLEDLPSSSPKEKFSTVTSMENSILKLQPYSYVALDTNVWLRCGILKSPDFVRFNQAIKKLLAQPFYFIVGAASYMEVSKVLLRSSVHLDELMPTIPLYKRRLLQMKWWAVSTLRRGVIVLITYVNLPYVRRSMSLVIKWYQSIKVERKIIGRSSRISQDENRKIRIQTIEKLFRFMDLFILAKYDQGEAAHWDDLDVIKKASFAIEAYDAQLVRQCARFGRVFVTLDKGLKHKNQISCMIDGVKRKMLVWNLDVVALE